MFYLYHQNNSGGRFYTPAVCVAIEATTPQEANLIAEQNGIYFNGVEKELDCDCCGDRWHSIWEDIDNTPDGYTIVATATEAAQCAERGRVEAEMDNIPHFLLLSAPSTIVPPPQ